MVSQCTLIGNPICRDHVQGVHEVDDGAEGEFGEVDGQNVLGCLGVLAVEFRHKSPRTFDIFRWSPFVFLYAVSLPMYEVLEFPLRIQLSSMSSTSYSSTPSWMTGGGGSC